MSSNVCHHALRPGPGAPADEADGGYMMWVFAVVVGLYLLVTIAVLRLAMALWRLASAGMGRKRLARIAILPDNDRTMATIPQPDATPAG